MKNEFVDLSHQVFNCMTGYQYKKPDSSIEHFTLQVDQVLDRKETNSLYDNDVEFLLSKVTMHTAIGTYIDVPFHRYEHGRDHSDFSLADYILDGICIDLTRIKSDTEIVAELSRLNVKGKAILFHFGMDKHWGTPEYTSFGAISEEIIMKLIEFEVKLVGVDTINIDKFSNLHRPAHSQLLINDILIIENMKNLDLLFEKKFRLYAVPLNIKGVANFPIRVFAEIL
ncbi:MAG: Kynurenine formamidase [Candidatus Heimdallarchaeota archaeon LC_2]|nr:MAG: Kynurenine formamidase [Candidatus Heimdallarchaeota archaeon LC_2]